MELTKNRIEQIKIYTWVYIFEKDYLFFPKILFLIRLRL